MVRPAGQAPQRTSVRQPDKATHKTTLPGLEPGVSMSQTCSTPVIIQAAMLKACWILVKYNVTSWNAWPDCGPNSIEH